MQINGNKSLERILTAFSGLGAVSKKVIRYGTILFILLLVTGLILMQLNYSVLAYSSYIDLVAKSIVKTSFSIAAEAIIGGLLLDYVFKK